MDSLDHPLLSSDGDEEDNIHAPQTHASKHSANENQHSTAMKNSNKNVTVPTQTRSKRVKVPSHRVSDGSSIENDQSNWSPSSIGDGFRSNNEAYNTQENDAHSNNDVFSVNIGPNGAIAMPDSDNQDARSTASAPSGVRISVQPASTSSEGLRRTYPKRRHFSDRDSISDIEQNLYSVSDSETGRQKRRRRPLRESAKRAVPFSVSSRSRFHSEALKPTRRPRSLVAAPSLPTTDDERGGSVRELRVPLADGGEGSRGGEGGAEDEEEEEEEERTFGLWADTTRTEKLALACLALVDVSSQMCLSIMAPFFPDEAYKKGVSSTVSGWIFGVFALVQFVSSPFFGKLLPHVGSRFMITAGQFFSGGCIILFGLMDYLEPSFSGDNSVFVALCFTLRVCLALGCTASSTASFAVTANCFPDHVSTVFGLLETATGLGMMLGPALGGVLFQAGGFVLPFAILGGFMLLTVPVNLYCLPERDENRVGTQPVSFLALIRIPAIIVTGLAVVMSALLWAMMDPTLAPHLAVIPVTPAILGLLFLLMSAVYAICSPIWGWIADKMTDSSPLIAIGFLLTGGGLLLLGPSTLLGFAVDYNVLWLNIVALSVLGVSVSLAIVPTFDKILDSVEKAGIEDSFGMYSYVASIWGGCYALGEFIGPSLGGWLVDTTNFAWTMTYTSGACVVMAIIIFIHALYERCRRPSATSPLAKDPDIVAVYADAPLSSEVTALLSPSLLTAGTYGSTAHNGTVSSNHNS